MLSEPDFSLASLAVPPFTARMTALPDKLMRWQSAGVIDSATAQAILDFEAGEQTPERWTWQVRIAMLLGAVLLGAGILLFVAAHWDQLSPAYCILIVLGALIGLHAGGVLAAERQPTLSTSLHAVGTLAAGGAIALLGQIFNMNEHWPSAILLWALCALAGAILLRDAFQRAFTLLLVPLWIGCEWLDHTSHYPGADIYLGRFLLIVGVVYLAAFLHEQQRALFRIVFTCGAVMLPLGMELLSQGWQPRWINTGSGTLPTAAKLLAWLVLLGVAAVALRFQRSTAIPIGTALVLALTLPWLVHGVQHSVPSITGTQTWTDHVPSVFFFLITCAGCVALIYAGLRQHSAPLVNYGTVAFGATVLWFYFADVWDKLGRSLGLLLMGALFLVIGFVLENTRRRLLLTMERAA